jgi:hypothetical protein
VSVSAEQLSALTVTLKTFQAAQQEGAADV